MSTFSQYFVAVVYVMVMRHTPKFFPRFEILLERRAKLLKSKENLTTIPAFLIWKRFLLPFEMSIFEVFILRH